jgi:threonine/homoserine/homoserine lactone efflux protein
LLGRELIAFLATAVIVIVTPGQDTALTIRNTLVGGRRSGVRTAAGVFAGNLVWGAASSAGLAAVLLASEALFVTLKWVGAAYLVYLGLRALRDVLRGRQIEADPTARPLRPFRQGLLSNLGNPKIGMFFTSLLPQFAGSFPALVALAATFASMGLVWLSMYAVVVARAGDVLRRTTIRRALDAVTGTVLVALGVRLAAAHRG